MTNYMVVIIQGWKYDLGEGSHHNNLGVIIQGWKYDLGEGSHHNFVGHTDPMRWNIETHGGYFITMQ